ncbi:glycoside hydrolase family 18 protein [Rhodocollybia butyracea]|uniref:Glycoside hydrolase family 18 protein n=1 Tax=Rhodocollybia butyracea TaxID=206335 RepID=A0A9P5UE17_9AGAR|nr:glycoside hydrolase family 18 protein [Rhodocollybia butyracea]
MGYYPSWNSMILPPEQIDFTKFDWVDFAFVTLNQTSQLTFEDNSSSDILRRLVKSAHTSGKYAKVSIGGWDGSQYFSSAVATPASRQTCVEEIVNMVNEFDLDGVDFDWEYPGLEGSSGNQVNPSDSENFLALIQLLRPALPLGTKITAAVAQTPFAGRDGQPMSDVANFSQVLDWVMIMAYDVWQSSSDPGPNAPLYDGCSNSSQPEASVASSVKQWTQANFPAKQISLGVPFYGYVSDSNATSLRSRASSPSIRVVADGGAAQGSIAFNYIVNQGALAATSNGTYIGSHGFTRSWDQCSATPFLQSQTSRQIITYDDPESLWMKGRFAKEMGLLGVSSWDLTGDTSTWNLTASLIAGCS